MIIKYYTYQIQRKNIQNLLEHTISNWGIWETQEEMDIMQKFASEGRFLTLFYIIYIYSSEIIFLILPFYPRLMDIIVPLNESRPLKTIIRAYYFVDEEEYFYSIYFHMGIVIMIGITVLIASDSLFLVFNSHICGLFSAIGFRLEHLFKNPIDLGHSFDSRARKMCFDNVVHSIKNHKRALEFADLIETSYSVSLMMQAFMGMIGVSVSLFQILMLLDKTAEALRFVIFASAQYVHLLCICYPGQRMIDYSTEIRFNAYNGLWYEAPIEVHRLMLLIIRRSIEPCYLTAGKTFVFCLETYAKIVQTSGSYFMVILSTH
ncbi:odorant receptor 67c-like isoform X2 [Vespa velutina]|uniref:odorant receptor 67c-like isoform X2 n=1 Tax=Vespa velutina TaxID=202808 RepID=UPI001FB54FE7|nr:odorant receptor 67c-like isoform X2 [Vespa velutina]